MSKKVIVYLAEGFEETEAIFPIDVLRRAKLDVTVASCAKDLYVTSSHNVTIKADVMAEDVDKEEYDAVFLPGGMPGSSNLFHNLSVTRRCMDMNGEGKVVSAICAAPAVVLANLGILDGRKATCYPGCEEGCRKNDFSEDGVVVDGNVITGKSAAFACDLALEIVRALLGNAMVVNVETQLYIE